jgi:hypothetical protein
MGSSITSVGSAGGKPVFTFTASGQDTGVLPLMNECSRWPKWMFQVVGAGTGYTVTLYGTIDTVTAYQDFPLDQQPVNNYGSTGNEWFPLPAPSVEAGFQWTNPLTTGNALYTTAPLVAVRAVSSTTIGFPGVTGEVTLLAFVLPG